MLWSIMSKAADKSKRASKQRNISIIQSKEKIIDYF